MESITDQIQQAVAAHRQGRLDEAERIYFAVLDRERDQPDALHFLGVLRRQQGRPAEAVELITKAAAAAPHVAAIHNNLGNVLCDLERFSDAVAAYRQAVLLRPSVESHFNLGDALKRTGDTASAAGAFRAALDVRPDFAAAYVALVKLLLELDKVESAAETGAQAVRMCPQSAAVHTAMGMTLHTQSRLEEAMQSYRRALELDPNHSAAYSNMGAILAQQQKLPEAEAAYRKAIELDPQAADAHWNLALALLSQGKFKEGWEEYEWRLRTDQYARLRRKDLLNLRKWQPETDDVRGKRILFHCEGGFGDALQFVRYVPMVAKLGARVVLECDAPLHRLFGNIPGVSERVPRGQIPAVDFHYSMLSLPRFFHTDLTNIPPVPYLAADAATIARWKSLLDNAIKGSNDLKVGLVWSGSGVDKVLRTRHLSVLAPLASIAGVQFVSLQVGSEAAQVFAPPAGMKIVHFINELKDFNDTAALIANLDLVISVDTSVAHLAGAIGKPVWVMIPAIYDFRWMAKRTDSPWYPTMRLFRQEKLGDWSGVVAEIERALRELGVAR